MPQDHQTSYASLVRRRAARSLNLLCLPCEATRRRIIKLLMPPLCKGRWRTAGAAEGLFAHFVDLLILLNDSFTIPHPLRRSTLGSAMRLQHKGAFGEDVSQHAPGTPRTKGAFLYNASRELPLHMQVLSLHTSFFLLARASSFTSSTHQ